MAFQDVSRKVEELVKQQGWLADCIYAYFPEDGKPVLQRKVEDAFSILAASMDEETGAAYSHQTIFDALATINGGRAALVVLQERATSSEKDRIAEMLATMEEIIDFAASGTDLTTVNPHAPRNGITVPTYRILSKVIETEGLSPRLLDAFDQNACTPEPQTLTV